MVSHCRRRPIICGRRIWMANRRLQCSYSSSPLAAENGRPAANQSSAWCSLFNVLNWCHTFFLSVCLFFWHVGARTAALWLSCTLMALASPQHPRLARIRVASWRSCFPAKSSLTDHSLFGKKHTPPYSGDPNLWLRNTVFKKWEPSRLPDRFVRSAADPSTWLSDDRLFFPSQCGCLLLSEHIAMDTQAHTHARAHASAASTAYWCYFAVDCY